MKNPTLIKNVVCFGEILWDIAPDGKTPGGAPMNVACHLQNFGLSASLVSRVGLDPLGKELVKYLNGRFLGTDYLQYDKKHGTCQVKVNTDQKLDIKYEFDKPTAWDFIKVNKLNLALVQKADAIVFGSLASRNKTTKKTLFTLLQNAKHKIFDINLRPPFIDMGFISEALTFADVLKINDEELDIISQWFGFTGVDEEKLYFIKNRFSIGAICLTRGEKGAWSLEGNQIYKQKGFPVKVEDTIGAGDSFLAAYIAKLLDESSPYERLQFACAVGAVVSTFKGANPIIQESEISDLMIK